MTTPRRSRPPLDFDRDVLLAQLRQARRGMVEAQAGMRPRTGLYRCADAVISEIDEFALVLTGDRQFFHASPHSALMGKGPVEKD